MQARAHRVVIVGAGPVGLALALALARHGVRSVVLEQRSLPDLRVRATALMPRTLEMMAQWQILPAILRVGLRVEQLAPWWPGDARPLFCMPLEDLCGPSSQPAAITLPQSQTETILAHALAEAGASEIRRGHRLVGFERRDKGVRCTVRPLHGEPYVLDGDFLVGCDGPRSSVRQQLGWPMDGPSYGRRMLMADIRVPDAMRDEQPSPHVLVHGDQVTLAHRVASHLWRVTGTLRSYETDAQALGAAALRARCASVLAAGLWQVVWADTFAIGDKRCVHYYEGRVVLAGDAVHTRSWSGSQSLNAGLHDAHNLAWKLARAGDAADACDIEVLLHAYQSERRSVESVDLLCNLSMWVRRARLGAWLRRSVARRCVGQVVQLAIARPATRHWLARLAGVASPRYTQSSLILGHHALVGALAPNVALRNDHGTCQYLLDGLYGHALLIFFDAGSGAQVLPALRHGLAGIEGVALRRVVPASGRAGPMSLRDTEGLAWQAWHARDGMVALVRPDGHIGWISSLSPSTEEVWTHVRHALGMAPQPMVAPRGLQTRQSGLSLPPAQQRRPLGGVP